MVRTRILTVVSLGCLALGGACSRPTQDNSQPTKSLPPQPVQVALASKRPLERVLNVAGALFAHEQTPVSARVAGRIQSLPVDLGARVQAGDLLAEMESREYELRVRQSRALLGQARARLGLPLDGDDDQVSLDTTSLVREAQAVLNQAHAERDRLAELSRQGIASAADLESANAAYSVAQSRHSDALEEARTRAAVLQQRRAEYELARKQLADTRITAPFGGIVAERRASLGQHLEIGSPLLTLVKADPLRLRVEVPEKDAPRVVLGQTVRIHLTGDTNTYTGTVRRLSPALLEASRMLVVEADVPASGSLRPGAFARAEIVVDTGFPGVTIPSDGLVTFAGVERVFLCEDGKAVERRVTTGDRGRDWIEITAGLKGGESIIRSPAGLVNNRPVFIATNAPAAKNGT